MSDLLGGLMIRRFWDGRAEEQSQATENDWRSLAKKLQRKLGMAEETILFRQVELDAQGEVLRLALEALGQANPSSPLLDKANRQILCRRHIATALAKLEYKFDVTTGEVERKVR